MASNSTAHPHALAQRLLGGLESAKTASWECASHSVAWSDGRPGGGQPPHLIHFAKATVTTAFGPVRATNGVPEGVNTLDERAIVCAHAASSLSEGLADIARVIRERLGADQVILTGRWGRKTVVPSAVIPEPFDMETAGEAARRVVGLPTDQPLTVRVRFRRLRGVMRPIVGGWVQPDNADLRQPFNDLLSEALAPWAARHEAWIASFSSIEMLWIGIPQSRHAAMRAAAAAGNMGIQSVPASTVARFERFLLDVEKSLGALRLGLRRNAAGLVGLCPAAGKERTPLERTSGALALSPAEAPFLVPTTITPMPCRPFSCLADRMRPALGRVEAATGQPVSIRIRRALHATDCPVTTIDIRSGKHRPTLTQRGRNATWHARALTVPFDAAEGVAVAVEDFLLAAHTNANLDIVRLDARYGSTDAFRPGHIAQLPGIPEELLTHLGVTEGNRSATVLVAIARGRGKAFRFRVTVHRSGTGTTDAVLAGLLRSLWRRWIADNAAALAGISRITVAMDLSAAMDQRTGLHGEPLRSAVAHALIAEATERHRVALAVVPGGTRLVPIESREFLPPCAPGALALPAAFP